MFKAKLASYFSPVSSPSRHICAAHRTERVVDRLRLFAMHFIYDHCIVRGWRNSLMRPEIKPVLFDHSNSCRIAVRRGLSRASRPNDGQAMVCWNRRPKMDRRDGICEFIGAMPPNRQRMCALSNDDAGYVYACDIVSSPHGQHIKLQQKGFAGRIFCFLLRLIHQRGSHYCSFSLTKSWPPNSHRLWILYKLAKMLSHAHIYKYNINTSI